MKPQTLEILRNSKSSVSMQRTKTLPPLLHKNTNVHKKLLITKSVSPKPSEKLEKKFDDIDVLCRACANSNPNLLPIFHGKGAELDLITKIHKYLPIRISEDDSLSSYLCCNCTLTINAFHNIVEGCLEAEQKLIRLHEDRLQKISQEEETTANTEHDDIKDPEEFNAEPPGEKVVDATQDKDEENSKEVVSREVKTKRLKEVSEACRIELRNPSREALLSPLKHIAVRPDEPSVDSPTLLKKISQELPTDSTNLPFLKVKKIVPIGRRKEQTLRNSKAKHKKSFTCEVCDRSFKIRAVYECHLKEHKGQKSFTCHVCGKQFAQTGSLYYHLKHVHDGVKNHACDICGRCFAMKTTMQDHRRIHTGERPYICDICGKTFKSKASLYIHSKIHSDQFKFTCSYCNKPFKFKQHMLGHMTTHTGIKNHTCDTCGKSFGVKWDLTRHLRIHSTEKPFVCDQCGMSFAQKRYLASHKRFKHKTE